MLMSFLDGLPLYSLAITLLIIFSTLFVYRKLVKPYKEFLFYKRTMQHDYKTLVNPFNILGMGTFSRIKSDEKTYGDSQYTIKHIYPSYQVVLSNFMGHTIMDLMDHDLIKDFFEKQAEGYYVKTTDNPFASSIKSMLGNGLIFSEGNEWKMKKKIMSNVFNHEFIKSKVGLIARICQDKIEEVEATATTESGEVKMDVSNLFQRIFGNVVVKSFFGDIELNKLEGVELFTYINEMFQGNSVRCLTLFAFLLGPNFYKYNIRAIDRQVNNKNSKFHEFAKEKIMNQLQLSQNSSRGQNAKIDSIIDLLISQKKLKANSESSISQTKDYYTIDDLSNEFKTFFSAGTDTTTNSTTFLIYLLAQNPTIQEKLRTQINQVFKSPFDINDITYQNLRKLTYFDNVFKETLRMYSPNAGLFARVAVKDHYIGKIPVKKGVLVSVKIKPNHFKQEFFKNPLQFDPDRWAKADPSKAHPLSYFPFSSGQRTCIGQHLATLQSKIAVICLLKRYSKISLEKPNFKKYMRTLYAAEQMNTIFTKSAQ